MLTFNIEKIRNLVKIKCGDILSYKPVGNHKLKRHLVYHLSCENGEYIIKLYYKKNRWNNEIACLKHLSETNIPIPQIIDYGVMDDETEWLLYEHIPGELLVHVEKQIDKDNLEVIYNEMGKYLAVIHTFKTFDYFGRMNVDGESLKQENNYNHLLKTTFDFIIDDLHKEEHDDPEVIQSSIENCLKLFCVLDKPVIPRLCHNDYGPRNILVSKQNGVYTISGIIDFEQSTPSDYEKELIYNLLPLKEDNPHLYNSFKSGYEEINEIDMISLANKKDFYNLYGSLCDCSWAKENAYDYYLKNLNILRKTLNNLK